MHMPRKFTPELGDHKDTYYGVKLCDTYNTKGGGRIEGGREG